MVYHWSNRQVNIIRVYYEINTTTNSMQLKWKFWRDKRKMHMYYLMPAYLSLYVTHSSIITSNFKSFCQQFEQFMKLSSVCVCVCVLFHVAIALCVDLNMIEWWRWWHDHNSRWILLISIPKWNFFNFFVERWNQTQKIAFYFESSLQPSMQNIKSKIEEEMARAFQKWWILMTLFEKCLCYGVLFYLSFACAYTSLIKLLMKLLATHEL